MAAVSLLSSQSTVLRLPEGEHGLQLTLSKDQLHPLQLLVLIVFSPAFRGASSQLVPVSGSFQE